MKKKNKKKITNVHELYAPCILGSDLLSCLHLENQVAHIVSCEKMGVSDCTIKIYICFCPEVVL